MQTRTYSIIETATSTAIGFLISFVLTLYVLPLWGFKPTMGQAWEITCIFTIASLVRGYVVRRIFNGK